MAIGLLILVQRVTSLEIKNFSINTEQVNVANGENIAAKGKGSGTIKVLSNTDNAIQVKIRDVLYVPGISGNLLSVKRLIDNGYTVNFSHDCCEIKKDGKRSAIADVK